MDIQDKYQKQIVSGRAALLMLIILTVVNAVLKIGRSSYYFLFSARIPEYIASFGFSIYYQTGRLTYLIFSAILVAFLLLLLYVVCYLFYTKHPAFSIIATSMFFLDSALFFLLLVVSGYKILDDITLIIDLLFHIGVLVILLRSVTGTIKLKKLAKKDI